MQINPKEITNFKGKVIFSTLGIIVISFGIAVCTIGGVGADPFTAMNIGIAGHLGLSLGVYQLIVNLIILAIVFKLDNSQIGFGTLINLVAVGFLVDFFRWVYDLFFTFGGTIIEMGIYLIVGVLLFTLGVSMYMKARMGVSPIDAVAPIASKRLNLPYLVCRVTQDILVTIIAIIAGGPIGIFTIIAAFFTGPLITFWNKFFSLPLVRRLRILTPEEYAEEKKTS